MRALFLLPLLIALTLPVAAQESAEEQRSNHYLDHVVLGVSNLEHGMMAFESLTGIKPKKDGSDAALGTHSAIAGLGENTFLEIIAPDPKVDAEAIDSDLNDLIRNRLAGMDELTPFRWSIGTSNLEKTTQYMRRASSRPSEIMSGSRKRGWGRQEQWRWVKVNVPESQVTPFFTQWADESKRPQERAPQGCLLETLRVNSRNFKSVLNLAAAMQIEIDLNGAEEDSLSFELECGDQVVVFDHVPLTIIYEIPGLKQRK